jgi:hypothetical protein
MPRASPEPDRKDQGLELAKHKAKIRHQKEEIDKLKRSNKLKDLELAAKADFITKLSNAYNYLNKTAKSEADAV